MLLLVRTTTRGIPSEQCVGNHVRETHLHLAWDLHFFIQERQNPDHLPSCSACWQAMSATDRWQTARALQSHSEQRRRMNNESNQIIETKENLTEGGSAAGFEQVVLEQVVLEPLDVLCLLIDNCGCWCLGPKGFTAETNVASGQIKTRSVWWSASLTTTTSKSMRSSTRTLTKPCTSSSARSFFSSQAVLACLRNSHPGPADE